MQIWKKILFQPKFGRVFFKANLKNKDSVDAAVGDIFGHDHYNKAWVMVGQAERERNWFIQKKYSFLKKAVKEYSGAETNTKNNK